ncbi:MAG TPA: sigma-70 family RNA polymerase sigma factor, partial [Tenericutes bacterium]|nr:sigma-70 family RNA polymerase sigma factor [Mycoplasmatota bacterium]
MKIVLKLKKLFIKLLNEAKVIFYITGKNQLPPPLSKKEERKLLERYQNGDIEARNKLIEHNLRLVIFIAKKFDSGTYLIDDLISVGSMGLIKAIDSFKLDKDIKLATYASRCIENEILMMFRRLSKHKNNVSLSDVLKIDSEGNELVLSDLIKASEEELSEKFERAEEKR